MRWARRRRWQPSLRAISASISRQSRRCTAPASDSQCMLQMGKPRSLDELDEVGQEEEMAAISKLYDQGES